MSKIVEFLHECKVFYLATVDEDQAQVRPINSVMEYHGKIYFETSNKKKMYQQMLKRPKVAISGMAESEWIRITGKVVVDDREELKDAMFEAMPALKNVYTREELIVYYLEDMDAKLCGFGTQPVSLED
ncbi:MAG: pyridoxamine 5'-phosphate oxidase family protein [Eubacteriales bacterium]|nr:pyridoxamine 5'-phosphate oxidase family protein [Eubacteriales bacterium]